MTSNRHRAAILAPLFLMILLGGCGDQGGKGAATATSPRSGTTAAAAVEDAQVVVNESGFTQDGETVSYGAVIENTSLESEVGDVQVSVSAVDANGDVLGTDDVRLTGLPADTTFNLGGTVSVAESDDVDKLDVAITTGPSSPTEHVMPEASNVRVSRDEGGGYVTTTVRAQITNTLDEPLSSLARVSCVLRGPGGEIVGGAFTFPSAEIPPGQKRGVELISQIRGMTADVSVENSVSD